LYPEWASLVTNLGFPIVVTLILLKFIVPNMATNNQVNELKSAIFRLDRNVVVMTIVIARATGVDYQEARRWVVENGKCEGGQF